MSEQPTAPETRFPDATPAGVEEIHLPGPSVWPFVVGGGITLFWAGIALGLIVTFVGTFLLIWGLGGWIQEMRREH